MSTTTITSLVRLGIEDLEERLDNYPGDGLAAHEQEDAKQMRREIAEGQAWLRRGRTSDAACLAFQPEAFDSAAAFFHRICRETATSHAGQGYTVDVIPTEGEPFTAEAILIRVGTDGQWKLVLWEWDEDAGAGDPERERVLDIYDELDRVEVC